METPVYDFVTEYYKRGMSRLHMPGHKGKAFLGCEARDITEITGADVLHQAEGILLESQENAARLFHSGRTLYSTEGSSLCIKAMLMALLQGAGGTDAVDKGAIRGGIMVGVTSADMGSRYLTEIDEAAGHIPCFLLMAGCI